MSCSAAGLRGRLGHLADLVEVLVEPLAERARPAGALEQERRRALHAVVHDRRPHAAGRVEQLHAAVVGGDQRALGGRHRDVELALGVFAVDEQRAGDAERDLRDAGEVLDVARHLGGILGVGPHVLQRGARLLGQEVAAGLGGLVCVVVGLPRDGDPLGGGCGGHERGLPASPGRGARSGGRAAARPRRPRPAPPTNQPGVAGDEGVRTCNAAGPAELLRKAGRTEAAVRPGRRRVAAWRARGPRPARRPTTAGARAAPG